MAQRVVVITDELAEYQRRLEELLNRPGVSYPQISTTMSYHPNSYRHMYSATVVYTEAEVNAPGSSKEYFKAYGNDDVPGPRRPAGWLPGMD